MTARRAASSSEAEDAALNRVFSDSVDAAKELPPQASLVENYVNAATAESRAADIVCIALGERALQTQQHVESLLSQLLGELRLLDDAAKVGAARRARARDVGASNRRRRRRRQHAANEQDPSFTPARIAALSDVSRPHLTIQVAAQRRFVGRSVGRSRWPVG